MPNNRNTRCYFFLLLPLDSARTCLEDGMNNSQTRMFKQPATSRVAPHRIHSFSFVQRHSLVRRVHTQNVPPLSALSCPPFIPFSSSRSFGVSLSPVASFCRLTICHESVLRSSYLDDSYRDSTKGKEADARDIVC